LSLIGYKKERYLMKKIIVLLVALFGSLAIFAPAVTMACAPGQVADPSGCVAAPVASGSSKDAVCEGVGLTTGSGGCAQPAGQTSVESIVRTVIQMLGLLVGVVSVIMIIFGGFRFVTSSGDSAKIATARETILYAIVGLVVAALSQAIVRFVLTKATTP
jgi:hypothetical protein